jgi:1-phosphofructokinase family hexose kinase
VINIETDAGGKGINCSRMLKRLGADTRALTLLGGKAGNYILSVLDKEGIPVDYVVTQKETRTTIAVEETSDVPPTTLNERGGPIEHAELVQLFQKAKDAAKISNYMLLGGSIPVGINPDVYHVLSQIATGGGAKVILDADGDAFAEGLKSKPFMIKPNRDEAERYLNQEFGSKSDVARAALKFAEMGIELVLISLGKQGVVACYDGLIYDAMPPEVKAVSTIGSGDSMIAGVVYSIEKGLSIEDALCMGCAAGAATAMSDGADIGEKSDVDTLLSQVKVSRLEPARV